jgi:hypothetical protein
MSLNDPPLKVRWLTEAGELGEQSDPKQPVVDPENSTTTTAWAGADTSAVAATNPKILKNLI